MGGSRQAAGAQANWFSALARAFTARGSQVVTGCCLGADAAVVSGLAGSQALKVFAVFGANGSGSWQWSAIAAVQAHASAGGRVNWAVGAWPGRQLAKQLSARTATVARAATSGAVVLFAAPRSRGSTLLARSVAARGLPVIAVAWGFPASQLPSLGAGSWVVRGLPSLTVAVAQWVQGQQGLTL